MLLLSKQAKGAKIVDGVTLEVFQLDATISEDHQHEWDWTDHPVEDGLAVSDHVVRMPDMVELEGVVTDTPYSRHISPTDSSLDRAREAYRRLVDIADRGQLLTITTGVTVYRDMAIVAIGTSRDASSGAAIYPRVSLKKVRLVNSVTIPVPPEILDTSAKGGGSTADAGKQAPPDEDLDEEGAEQKELQSGLVKINDAFVGQ